MRILPAIMSASAADRAEAARCPGWMEQYCVLSRDGVDLSRGLCHGIGPNGQPY
jgi:hypothetical protein